MSAPLYSRYCRYADREAKRFPHHSRMRELIPLWKRPQTRVYSLTPRASHEAGWWSGEEPGELLKAISLHYLPAPFTWIEFDWRAYNKGSMRMPLDAPDDTEVRRGTSTVIVNGPDTPLKLGFMFFMTKDLLRDARSAEERFGDADNLIALTFYLYQTGACFVGPAVVHWHPTQPIKVQVDGKEVIGPEDLMGYGHGVGHDYLRQYEEQHPRLTLRLRQLLGVRILGDPLAGIGKAVDGFARCAAAVLTATLSARPPTYAPALTGIKAGDSKPEWGTKARPMEVDLFIRERPRKPGGSIRASVGHLEGVKKGLHLVGAHYAYRNRGDGKDPTLCYSGMDGLHDFEDIPDSKSQVCVICNQKRWFKDQHKRGDEAYGIVPRKIRNVRLGVQSPHQEGHQEGTEP